MDAWFSEKVERETGRAESASGNGTMRRIHKSIIRFTVYFADEMTIKLNVIWHKNAKLDVCMDVCAVRINVVNASISQFNKVVVNLWF